jgi:membrane-bound lytic murein transglycosylase D
LPRYLICLLLLALAGCATGDRGMLNGQPGSLQSPSDENGSVALTEDGIDGELGLADTPASGEEVVEEETASLDPVTLEDMQLLSGEDQAPPEDEGETAVEKEISFDLPVVENAKVRYFVEYFTTRARDGFHRWLERSTRFLPMMREVFAEQGLPCDLAYLAMIESGFNTRAVSHARAVGPWQFMEGTGRMYGLQNDWWRDERRDPFKSTRAAARHLADLYQRYNDWYLAIAAYNAGAGKVDRAIKKTGSHDFWEISHTRYLAKETKHYLPKLLAAMLIAKEPEKYGFTDIDYLPALESDLVEIPSSTDLNIIARLTDVSEEEIRDLNPELKRWCTPPNHKDYSVRLPAGTTDSFQRQYAEIDPDHRANFQRHRLRSGETLSGLAHRYHIRISDIVRLNNIRNPRALRVGRNLILPMRSGATMASVVMEEDYAPARPSRYKVRNGDNLWTISRRLRVTTRQLCAWNGLRKTDILRPGQILKIGGSGGRRVARGSGSSYKVRNGDNLWTISRRFGMSTGQLCSLNGLRASDILKPGQVLRVSGRGAATVAALQKGTYQVCSGDNLWTISRRLGVTTAQLCSWNGLRSNDILQPGQVLQIEKESPNSAGTKKVVYQVRPGDTLWGIGRRFDLNARDIMVWNNLNSGHIIQPGDSLTLLLEEGQG